MGLGFRVRFLFLGFRAGGVMGLVLRVKGRLLDPGYGLPQLSHAHMPLTSENGSSESTSSSSASPPRVIIWYISFSFRLMMLKADMNSSRRALRRLSYVVRACMQAEVGGWVGVLWCAPEGRQRWAGG